MSLVAALLGGAKSKTVSSISFDARSPRYRYSKGRASGLRATSLLTCMLPTYISKPLPHPNSSTDPDWHEWEDFIAAERIPACDDLVVRCYQNVEHHSDYMPSNELNHLLNLRHFGDVGPYAELAVDRYGLEDDEEEHPTTATTEALEAVFSQKSCRFTADSVVFKGVSFEPFYAIHKFDSIEKDVHIEFPGFVSTTVCREKALDFVGSYGVLLVIRGLDAVDCIVPRNSSVQTTTNAQVPEHEVLLRRGVKMGVERVVPKSGSAPREVHLRVVPPTAD